MCTVCPAGGCPVITCYTVKESVAGNDASNVCNLIVGPENAGNGTTTIEIVSSSEDTPDNSNNNNNNSNKVNRCALAVVSAWMVPPSC
jgi:hypothetical protein